VTSEDNLVLPSLPYFGENDNSTAEFFRERGFEVTGQGIVGPFLFVAVCCSVDLQHKVFAASLGTFLGSFDKHLGSIDRFYGSFGRRYGIYDD